MIPASPGEPPADYQRKVLAYITRDVGGGAELLVFTHRDEPEAGLQVPAGTVEPGEDVEDALLREVQEESGLGELRLVAKLAVFANDQWRTVRHVFHLAPTTELPGGWAHVVHGDGEDAGLVFDYRWLALDEPIELAGEQGRWLGLIDA